MRHSLVTAHALLGNWINCKGVLYTEAARQYEHEEKYVLSHHDLPTLDPRPFQSIYSSSPIDKDTPLKRWTKFNPVFKALCEWNFK